MSGGGQYQAVTTASSCGPWEHWIPDLELTPDSISLSFDTNSATLVTQTPQTLATQTLDNKAGSISQSETYSFTKTLEATTSFEQTTGVTFTAGIEVTVGKPDVLSGKFSFSVAITT